MNLRMKEIRRNFQPVRLRFLLSIHNYFAECKRRSKQNSLIFRAFKDVSELLRRHCAALGRERRQSAAFLAVKLFTGKIEVETK
jgi:hypothetical protein